MEEKKEKNYYWIIPVVIGVFVLIGLGIFVFIVSIFSVVNTSLKIASMANRFYYIFYIN